MDPEKLLLAISDGKSLSDEEIAEVVELLDSEKQEELIRSPSVDDVYSCLLLLGKAKLVAYRHLLEKYLDCQEPLSVVLVLEILCLDWGTADEYLERVLHFALGVPWDYDEDVRQVALKIMGEFLAEGLPKPEEKGKKKASPRQLHVLELLFSIFEDESNDSLIRQSAYRALGRAYGKDWADLPSEYVLMDFEKGSDVDEGILSYLRRFSSHTESSSGSGRAVISKGNSSSGKDFSPGIR